MEDKNFSLVGENGSLKTAGEKYTWNTAGEKYISKIPGLATVGEKYSLKTVGEEPEALQEHHGREKENSPLGTIKKNFIDYQRKEISQLQNRNEQLKKMIQKLEHQNQELESISKANQNEIRLLVRNNEKKRKLRRKFEKILEALCEVDNDEDLERYEELLVCLNSFMGSAADESENGSEWNESI